MKHMLIRSYNGCLRIDFNIHLIKNCSINMISKFGTNDIKLNFIDITHIKRLDKILI